MKRNEIKNLIETINNKGFFNAVVLFLSPVTEKIEERHMYADSNIECLEWGNTVMRKYKDYNIPCMLYLNGELNETFRKDKISIEE